MIFAGCCALKCLVWVFVENGVTNRLFGVVGVVLSVDPGLVVETGPGGVGRRQK